MGVPWFGRVVRGGWGLPGWRAVRGSRTVTEGLASSLSKATDTSSSAPGSPRPPLPPLRRRRAAATAVILAAQGLRLEDSCRCTADTTTPTGTPSDKCCWSTWRCKGGWHLTGGRWRRCRRNSKLLNTE